MSDNKDNTTTTQMDISIDELLGTPGGDNIMVPDDKPTMFTRNPKQVDINKMLNEEDEEESSEDSDDSEEGQKKPLKNEDSDAKKKNFDDIINEELGEDGDESTEDNSKKGGRPTGLVELGTRLIEKGYLTPFEGEEDVSKYTLKDWEELFDSNEKEKDKKKYEQVSTEFYENLPEEMQVAAHYFANGGTDMKAIFRSLAAVEEIRELDPKDAQGSEQIVRSYLHATNFGDAEEIEEEI